MAVWWHLDRVVGARLGCGVPRGRGGLRRVRVVDPSGTPGGTSPPPVPPADSLDGWTSEDLACSAPDYLEYPEVNTAGSYLYEPAGSIHTLHVPPTNRETTGVWFAIRGANLNLDEQGNVESVWDAAFLIVSGRGVLPGADPGLVVDARNDLRELRGQRAPRRLGGYARVSCGEPRTERASGRRVDAVMP